MRRIEDKCLGEGGELGLGDPFTPPTAHRLEDQLRSVVEFMNQELEALREEMEQVLLTLGDHEWKLEIIRKGQEKLLREIPRRPSDPAPPADDDLGTLH